MTDGFQIFMKNIVLLKFHEAVSCHLAELKWMSDYSCSHITPLPHPQMTLIKGC